VTLPSSLVHKNPKSYAVISVWGAHSVCRTQVPVVLFRQVEMHMPGPYTSVGPSGHGAEVVVVAMARIADGGEGAACLGVEGLTGACGALGLGWPTGPTAGTEAGAAGAATLFG